ncbi:MAG: hypothetical protein ACNA77_01700 [Opitutales bacterium]
MRRFLLILSCFTVLAAQSSGKALDRIIATDADAVLTVRNISELRAAWKEHPLVLDLADTSLVDTISALITPLGSATKPGGLDELLEEFHLDAEALLQLFPGQAGLVLYNFAEQILQDAESQDLAILAEFSGTPERLDELMQIQFERNAKAQKEANPEVEHELIREYFMGETLYFDEVFDGEKTYIEDGYALVDGIFILATPEERLRTLVESIKAGTDAPLASSPAYQRVREASGPVDGLFYINFESFLPALNQALLRGTVPAPMAMFGMSGSSLSAALALRDWQGLGFDFKVQEDGLRAQSAIIYREKSGLFKLLAYGEGALPPAHYVPTGALSSSVSRFDLSEMFARLEAFLGAASPTAPALLNIQLQQIKTNSGVDLRRALLQNFGTEVVSFSILPQKGPVGNPLAPAEQVYVFQIKDAAALSGGLEALKDLVPGARGQIQTRDFGGEIIHTFSNAGAPTVGDVPAYNFSYVVTRTHLIASLGSIGTLQRVLTSMQSGDSGFWQEAEIEALIERVGAPGVVVARSYTDLGQALSSMLESIQEAQQLTSRGSRISAPTSIDMPWHFLAETYEAPDGLFSRMILQRKEAR